MQHLSKYLAILFLCGVIAFVISYSVQADQGQPTDYRHDWKIRTNGPPFSALNGPPNSGANGPP